MHKQIHLQKANEEKPFDIDLQNMLQMVVFTLRCFFCLAHCSQTCACISELVASGKLAKWVCSIVCISSKWSRLWILFTIRLSKSSGLLKRNDISLFIPNHQQNFPWSFYVDVFFQSLHLVNLQWQNKSMYILEPLHLESIGKFITFAFHLDLEEVAITFPCMNTQCHVLSPFFLCQEKSNILLK